jgi:outer membrane protein, heavy metal efflux system
MKLNFRFLTVVAFLSATAAVCYADETNVVSANGKAPVMSLEALVNEALQKNPELKFYEAEMDLAKAGRKQAGLWAPPQFAGEIGRKTSRSRTSGLSAEGVAWSVSVMQAFEWPGRIELRKAIANRDFELARLGLQRFRTALVSRVRLLGFGLYAAKEKAAAAREVANRFKLLREVVVQRDAAGITPLLEMRVIEATELTMQKQASEAEIAVESALLELNQLRGAAPEASFAVEDGTLEFQASDGTAKLLTLARTNNFELRSRAVELAQQGFRVELAKNERFPAVSVGPSYSEENAFESERIIGLSLSLPLPLWNRNTANIDSAKARQIQAETSMKVAQRDVERKVVEAASKYEAKLREIRAWRPEAVQHFRDAAELADRHYRLGAVAVSVYVELQKQYLEAVNSLLDTKKDALEAAQHISLLTGAPLPVRVTPAKQNPRDNDTP